MEQSESVALLTEAGLHTPESWRVTAASALPLAGDGPERYYYCRTLVDGSKVSATVPNEQLERLGSLAPDTATWLIQPLLDFTVSGAAFTDDGSLYVETVAGTAIGLLRHGELGHAQLKLDGSVLHFAAAQQSAWTYLQGELVEQAIGPLHAPDLEAVVEEVGAALSHTNLQGLFEWGWDTDRLTFLDLKPLPSTGALPVYVRRHLHPDPTRKTTSPSAPLPALTAKLPASGPLVFERGARLSHVNTYRCAAGRTDVTFQSW